MGVDTLHTQPYDLMACILLYYVVCWILPYDLARLGEFVKASVVADGTSTDSRLKGPEPVLRPSKVPYYNVLIDATFLSSGSGLKKRSCVVVGVLIRNKIGSM